MSESHWKPNDWLRLVALIGGNVLFAIGAYMLYLGIVAEGTVDIKSTILSGTLKTASAGLFICFFSFLLIVFVLISLLNSPAASSQVPSGRPRARRLMPIFWGCLFGILASGFAYALLPGGASAIFSAIAGFLLTTLAAIVFAIIRANSEDA